MMRQVLRRFCAKQKGGGHTQRECWRRKISLRSFDRPIARRLHSPPVADRRWNQLRYSTDRWCGFKVIVIDPTVAWILSRLVSTIRRVIDLYLFVGLTVVVSIPRLLAAVVSLEKKFSPSCAFCVSGKVNTAVLAYGRK